MFLRREFSDRLLSDSDQTLFHRIIDFTPDASAAKVYVQFAIDRRKLAGNLIKTMEKEDTIHDVDIVVDQGRQITKCCQRSGWGGFRFGMH